MSEQKDAYYSRREVSNSDLSWLKKYWEPVQYYIDLQKAFKFGTLIDCMITEPHKVDYFKLTCAGEQYTAADFEQATKMKEAFYRDPFCSSMVKQCKFQHNTIVPEFRITLDGGFSFVLPARCRWDLYAPNINFGADIKSTAATTQRQFEQAIRQLDYDRSRAWYMDLAGRDNDMLIGISKVNYQIFKVPIKRGDAIYKSGYDKYRDLAFRWWAYFGDERP